MLESGLSSDRGLKPLTSNPKLGDSGANRSSWFSSIFFSVLGVFLSHSRHRLTRGRCDLWIPFRTG